MHEKQYSNIDCFHTGDRIQQFWKIILALLFISLGALIGTFMAHIYYFNYYIPRIQPQPIDDAIAIANTYIVFISIIFILFTIAITIGGYVFAKIFTIEKQREIYQNIIIIAEQVKGNEQTRKLFFKEVFGSGSPIVGEIIHMMEDIIEKVKNANENTPDTEELKNEIQNIVIEKINELSSENIKDRR